jgi:hypothetical protein
MNETNICIILHPSLLVHLLFCSKLHGEVQVFEKILSVSILPGGFLKATPNVVNNISHVAIVT